MKSFYIFLFISSVEHSLGNSVLSIKPNDEKALPIKGRPSNFWMDETVEEKSPQTSLETNAQQLRRPWDQPIGNLLPSSQDLLRPSEIGLLSEKPQENQNQKDKSYNNWGLPSNSWGDSDDWSSSGQNSWGESSLLPLPSIGKPEQKQPCCGGKQGWGGSSLPNLPEQNWGEPGPAVPEILPPPPAPEPEQWPEAPPLQSNWQNLPDNEPEQNWAPPPPSAWGPPANKPCNCGQTGYGSYQSQPQPPPPPPVNYPSYNPSGQSYTPQRPHKPHGLKPSWGNWELPWTGDRHNKGKTNKKLNSNGTGVEETSGEETTEEGRSEASPENTTFTESPPEQETTSADSNEETNAPTSKPNLNFNLPKLQNKPIVQ